MGNAKKNTFTTSRINDTRVHGESSSVDNFQQVPNEAGDRRRSEELSQFASPLQVTVARIRNRERFLMHWFQSGRRNIHS
jgi:hypothetical protein